ncbi:hypothetical protein KP509_36G022900 [Ceratopteris richardii]|uniref:RING-type domain-containing protein n=1 Tax=Ceratopteris richardii TaxID=49495 RepID=A0A8T2QBH4_CERRI|nr:hypothetical protein KP509_36G022900 [Ceratopteris richardii]
MASIRALLSQAVDAEQSRPGHELLVASTSRSSSFPSTFDLKVLIVAACLFIVLLCGFCFNLALRWVKQRLSGGAFGGGGTNEAHPDATTGLKKHQLRSVPCTLFGLLPNRQASTCPQCAICLIDFEPTEPIRVLPPCQHVFHVTCVDIWLGKHASCPTCRGNIMQAMSAEATSHQVQLQIVIAHGGALSSSLSKADSNPTISKN